MVIGSLGKVVFRVSSSFVETFSNFKQTSGAQYSTHQRHGREDLPEFTGRDLDKITFNIELLASFGVDPGAEIEKLREYLRRGTTLTLVIGGDVVGAWRWVISAIQVTANNHDVRGVITSATVAVTLLEYPRE